MERELRARRWSAQIMFILVILLCASGWSFAYDLSADTVMIEDGERQDGKIYIKGDKYKIQRADESEYIVLRHDRGVMWVVMPNEKMYVQLPLDPKKTPRISEKNPGEISRRLLGTEVIEGHPADKFEITVKEGSRTESFYQWTAKDLNFPIKTAALMGEWSVEFNNLVTGIADNVFEIPPGYTRAKVGSPEDEDKSGAAPSGMRQKPTSGSTTIRSGARR